MPSATLYRVTVVSGTPEEADASAHWVWAQTGAMAARVYGTDRFSQSVLALRHLPALDPCDVLRVDAVKGAGVGARPTYYTWLGGGAVARTRATRPVPLPLARV